MNELYLVKTPEGYIEIIGKQEETLLDYHKEQGGIICGGVVSNISIGELIDGLTKKVVAHGEPYREYYEKHYIPKWYEKDRY